MKEQHSVCFYSLSSLCFPGRRSAEGNNMFAGGRNAPSFYFLEMTFLQRGSSDQVNTNAIPGSAKCRAKRNHSLIKQSDLLCAAGLSYSYPVAAVMTGRSCVWWKCLFFRWVFCPDLRTVGDGASVSYVSGCSLVNHPPRWNSCFISSTNLPNFHFQSVTSARFETTLVAGIFTPWRYVYVAVMELPMSSFW